MEVSAVVIPCIFIFLWCIDINTSLGRLVYLWRIFKRRQAPKSRTNH